MHLSVSLFMPLKGPRFKILTLREKSFLKCVLRQRTVKEWAFVITVMDLMVLWQCGICRNSEFGNRPRKILKIF
jgi:hypothetical protein